VLVSARCIILRREGIACPEDDHLGACSEHIGALRAIELTLVGRVSGPLPGLIFAWEVFGELLVLRDDRVREEVLAIVVDAHYLSATLQKRGDDEAKDED
jgi:hypothetical protein